MPPILNHHPEAGGWKNGTPYPEVTVSFCRVP
jgi:hypothetical protein